MSQNLCPKRHHLIHIPQEEVRIQRNYLPHGKTVDRMVHKVCPRTELPDAPMKIGQDYVPVATYCSQCGHPEPLHDPKCNYSNYGVTCDCKHYRK